MRICVIFKRPGVQTKGVMKTSALKRRPSTTFSTGRRWPDWAFLLVDVDHWPFQLGDVDQTELFSWSTSTADVFLVNIGRRPSTLSTSIWPDIFITPQTNAISVCCNSHTHTHTFCFIFICITILVVFALRHTHAHTQLQNMSSESLLIFIID